MIAVLDGGLSSLGALRELYFVLAPTTLLGVVSLVISLVTLVSKRASRRTVRSALIVAAVACAASVACVIHYARSLGDEEVALWFAAHSILVAAAASSAWFVARRRDA